MSETVLELSKVSKIFPGVVALNEVDFLLRKGEVHGLVGENGAGKSTMIKILAGVYKKDGGTIRIHGSQSELGTIQSSKSQGISIIYQELCLVPFMTVAENILLGNEPTNKMNLYSRAAARKRARAVLDRVGLELPLDKNVAELSVAEQQMVEIAKALSVDADIMVMDEPTSSLTEKEVAVLMDVIRKLKQKGVSVIYVSHKLEEIFEICDRVTVLRDGNYVVSKEVKDTTRDELIYYMVGREMTSLFPTTKRAIGGELLRLEGVGKKNVLHDISLTLHKGEILGITGLVGAKRTELARVLFGIDKYDSGQIFIDCQKVSIRNAPDAMKQGMAFVTEDRKAEGLFMTQDLRYNCSILALDRFIRRITVKRDVEESIVSECVGSLDIKASSQEQPVRDLSGGNQQKVVVSKWLTTNPRILVLDEPTRGIDVGAKTEMYAIIDRLAQKGMGILMISSELPEVINMSDRIVVMKEGRIAGILDKREFNQERILNYAIGGTIHES